MATRTQTGPSSSGGAWRATMALTVILTAQLMLQMDFLIVLVALPKIQSELGFTTAELSWVPNAFALAFGGLLLLGGRLGDMYGQVKIFEIGIATFVAASLLGGLAGTGPLLIAARVLQGAGGALAAPSVLALITNLAKDEAERNRGLSLFIAVSSIGASAGLILGGALTELLSWRWSLLINVPIGILVLLLISRLVNETPRKPAHLDVTGALTATLGSVALVYGFISAAEAGWLATSTIGAFALAVALIVAFLLVERRTTDPLLDLSLLSSRSRLGGLAVMGLIVGMHFSVLFFVVQYLQQVLAFPPLLAGAAYLPMTATVFAITAFVPRLIARFGPRRLLSVGGILVAVSLAWFAMLTDESAYFPEVVLPLILHAVGIALVFAPGTVAIMQGVPEEHAGTASGLLQMDQQIGGALGIAVIAAVYASAAVPGDFAAGLPMAFTVAALIALAASMVGLRTIRRAEIGNATARAAVTTV
jgi:EmrB/QacA subfamily drug resistance transporter